MEEQPPPMKIRYIDAESSDFFYSSDSRSSLDEPDSPDSKFCVIFVLHTSLLEFFHPCVWNFFYSMALSNYSNARNY